MLVVIEGASVRAQTVARRCVGWMGARASLPTVGENAGGRRGRQSHVNLQFSCSFFLQGEGIPNGRLRERAGRYVVLDAARETLEIANSRDCSRERILMGRCCAESCRGKQDLQADSGGFRSFDGFIEILRILRWPGHRALTGTAPLTALGSWPSPAT